MLNKNKNKLPLVVLFGRTNVGKSTLFNCLLEQRQALVSNIAGTTRDSNIGEVEWQGKQFRLIDTGGIINLDKLFTSKKTKQTTIDEKVQKQVSKYLSDADLILFIVDAKDGLLAQDKNAAALLKKVLENNDKIVLVVNKVEKQEERQKASEFYKLSLGSPMLLSAATGSGTGDLLDAVIEKLVNKKFIQLKDSDPEELKTKKEILSKYINICILGKPNVGKSSLLNKIIGEERVIVSAIPHTTREPQDSVLDYDDRLIRIIDTAGLSKKHHRKAKSQKLVDQARPVVRKVKDEDILSLYGISKSLVELKKSNIALFVWDINDDITVEDAKIVEEVVKSKKGLILVANKWDLVEERDVRKYTEYIRSKLPFVAWAPIQFISAKTGEKLDKLMDIILEIDEARKIELSDSQLQKFLVRVVKVHRPSRGKGFRHPRIYELTQTGTNPPEFKVRIGKKDDLHFSYLRFLENRLREKFGFLGTYMTLWVSRDRDKDKV